MRLMSAPQIFDRRAVRLHRDRAASSLGRVLPVLEECAERLLDRLDDTRRPFRQALDLGGRGIIAPMLRARGIEVVSSDLSRAMAALNGPPFVVADEEWLPFAPGSFDLVVASLSLHWVNDLPGALIQIRQVLRSEGLFLASVPALGTLAELRTALTDAEAAASGGVSPRVSPFPELRDLAGLMGRAGFTVPVADVEDITLSYGDPLGLFRDLQAAGESNAVSQRDRRPPAPSLFAAAASAMAGSDGRIPATLRLGTMTGWAS